MVVSTKEINGLGAMSLLDRVTDNLSAVKPQTPKTPVKAPEAKDPVLTSKVKPITNDFDGNAKDSEKSDISSWMLLSVFAEKSHAEDQPITSNSIADFIKGLEAMGVDTSGVRKIVENISGQPYETFAKSNSSREYSVGDFYSSERTGVNIPRNSGASGPRISNEGFDSARAIQISQTDNAGGGYCAKGTANILERMGIPIQRGHATGWDENFEGSRNWVRLKGVSPASAPEGSVLTYDSDLERGKPARNKGGGTYGHVEIVAHNRDGQNVYVSDKARHNAGGSVPDNYAGAFMYVGPGAPASNMQIAQRINGGGVQMARGPSFDPVG